jgi:hypothetical protein
MCPSGDGQIQTLLQAGGIASERMRLNSAGSSILQPSLAMYRNPLPARTRRMPGAKSDT